MYSTGPSTNGMSRAVTCTTNSSRRVAFTASGAMSCRLITVSSFIHVVGSVSFCATPRTPHAVCASGAALELRACDGSDAKALVRPCVAYALPR